MKPNLTEIFVLELEELVRPFPKKDATSDEVIAFFATMGYHLDKLAVAGAADNLAAICRSLETLVDIYKDKAKGKIRPAIRDIDWPALGIQPIQEFISAYPENMDELLAIAEAFAPEVKKLRETFKDTQALIKKIKVEITDTAVKAALTDALTALPKRLLDYLVFRYCIGKHAVVLPAFEFFDFIKYDKQLEIKNGNDVLVEAKLFPSVQFSNLSKLLKNPEDYFKNRYWPNGFVAGSPNRFAHVSKAGQEFFGKLKAILEVFGAQTLVGFVSEPALGSLSAEEKERLKGMMSFSLPLPARLQDSGETASTTWHNEISASIGFLVADPDPDGGPGIFFIPSGDFSFFANFGGWMVETNATLDPEGFKINKNGLSHFKPGLGNALDASAKIYPQPDGIAAWVFGPYDDSRIEIGKPILRTALKSDASGKAEASLFLDFPSNKIVVVKPGGNDLLNFALGVGWSNQKGFYIVASNLTAVINLDLTLFHILHLSRLELSLQGNQLQILVAAAIELPKAVFQPLLADGVTIDTSKTAKIDFTLGGLLSTNSGAFQLSKIYSFNFPKCAILNSGFTIELQDVELDLSHSENIPAAIADGRPADFIGVSMKKGTIGFPTGWNHNAPGSTGELFVKDFLAGTGGISGTIGLRLKKDVDPNTNIQAALSVCFGTGFKASLTSFSLKFRQNAILETNIEGKMVIPGFKDANDNDAEIEIKIHFDHNGDFYIAAKEEDGIALPLNMEKFLSVTVKSLTVGRRSKKFFVAVSGDVSFENKNSGSDESSVLGGLLPKNVEIQKLLIWENGQIELEGGVVTLAKPIKLNLGPVKLTVTALGMGSHERMFGGELRKYKYVEFSAGVSVNPGGVDARGDGIKVYFTCDGKKFNTYIRIQSISIDLIIPGSASKDQATLLLSGYLSMKEPSSGDEDSGTEYAGGIDFKLPKMKMGGSADMRYNPKVPSFLIDVSLEMSTPIVLGATGMGIYGFRALFGKRYIASKTEAPVSLPADAEWWQYYKKKVPPKPREGITASKMANLPGFSFGAGVSLATATDGGKAFSSKVFFLLSLPDVFLLQGQAQILKGRIGLDDETDPPFYCLIAIDKTSISSAMGVSYKIPDSGAKPGSIITVDALIEMAYFWRDSKAWYLNIGRDLPVDRRVRARIFDLFEVYSYFMLNASGIRTGAGASIEKAYNVGPISATMRAYMDTAGRLSFKPLQIGGSIQIGGNVDVKVLGFGFSVVASAFLAAEAPRPFIVTGAADACVKVLKKEYCCHFDFTWTFEKMLDFSEVPIIGFTKAELQDAVKALNMMTLEPRELLCFENFTGFAQIPPPGTGVWINPDADDYILPMDSFIDIEFKKPVNPYKVSRLGGTTSGAEFTDYIAPQRGKSDRVRHDYHLENVEIFSWEPVSETWKPYNVFEALIAGLKKPPFKLTVTEEADLLQKGQYGFWQIDSPGKYNKLRLLAQNPLSFLRQGTGDTIPEELGVTNGIFCPPPSKHKTCVNFDSLLSLDAQGNPFFKEKKVAGNKVLEHRRILWRLVRNDGELLQKPLDGVKTALAWAGADTLELYLPEPSTEVNLLVGSNTTGLIIKYLARQQKTALNPLTGNPEPLLNPAGLPVFEYKTISTVLKNPTDLPSNVPYLDLKNPVDKIEITGKVPSIFEKTNVFCEAGISNEAKALLDLLNLIGKTQTERGLVKKADLMKAPFNALLPALFPKVPASSSLVWDATVDLLLENKLVINFIENGGPVICQATLTAPPGSMNKASWSQPGIWKFKNLRPDTTATISGANTAFLIDMELPNGTILTLKGNCTCVPVFHCYDRFLNFFHQICYLTQADAQYNENLPSQTSVNQNNEAMALAINKTLWPVWRPNTAYAIRVKYTDEIFQESNFHKSHSKEFAICFKTKGPTGHYHEFDDTGLTSKKLKSYTDLETSDREDAFKLATLKHCVDFQKSYPNADGNILNAKPLYFENPELRLFYIYPHVYQFYQDWPAYNGLKEVKSALEVLIKDPAEVPMVPGSDGKTMIPFETPLAVNEWKKHDSPIITPDIAALNNMVNNGIANQNPCPPPATKPFTPPGVFNLVKPNPNAPLEPLKLYTAIYNAAYNPDPINQPKPINREVHRYAFQTSRYKDFGEHIRSYILYDDPATKNIEKAAVYRIDLFFRTPDGDDDPMPLLFAQQVLDKSLPADHQLHTEAALDFDKIIDRLFALKSLEPAETVQFNAIFNSSGYMVGILVRSPEPFNDPKTPENELAGTLEMLPTKNVKPGIKYFNTYFSKDNACAFITNANNVLNIPVEQYQFTFRYKLFNGLKYEIQDTQQVVIDFSTLK